MHTRIILKFVEKYRCPGIAFSRAPDVSNEQPCLKTTRLYDDHLLLSFVSLFLFHIQCSHFIKFSNFFPIFSNSFFFWCSFSKLYFIKCSRKAFVYGYMLLLLLLLLSRFSRVQLCDPIDSSPPGSPVPGILQFILTTL